MESEVLDWRNSINLPKFLYVFSDWINAYKFHLLQQLSTKYSFYLMLWVLQSCLEISLTETFYRGMEIRLSLWTKQYIPCFPSLSSSQNIPPSPLETIIRVTANCIDLLSSHLSFQNYNKISNLSSARISYFSVKSSSINYNIDYVATIFPQDYICKF